MSRRWIYGWTLFLACAAVPIERQHLADGSWQLTCHLPMEGCVREIENICKGKRYRILGGQSEVRLRDAPFVTEYVTSRLGFVCADEFGPLSTSCTPDSGAGPCDHTMPPGSGVDGGQSATSSDAAVHAPGSGFEGASSDAARMAP